MRGSVQHFLTCWYFSVRSFYLPSKPQTGGCLLKYTVYLLGTWKHCSFLYCNFFQLKSNVQETDHILSYLPMDCYSRTVAATSPTHVLGVLQSHRFAFFYCSIGYFVHLTAVVMSGNCVT